MARKIGESIHPETGEVLAELFGPERADDALSMGLRIITHQLSLRQPGVDLSGGLFGGEFGYGADFENDVFLMHPYCWCGKSGECPWCTGCAIYHETGSCKACAEEFPHSAVCYQTEMNQALKAAGLAYILEGKYVPVDNLSHEYEKRRATEAAIYTDLCAKHGLDREVGAGIHCDCGANEQRNIAIDNRGCDYQRGGGIFERFKPYSHLPERHYYGPPNFWHKATNCRVTWYKYIGRENATNSDISSVEWGAILKDVLASLGAPSLDESMRLYVAVSEGMRI